MARIVVLGGGESGVGSAILAKTKGFNVFLSDKGKIDEKYSKVLDEWGIKYESEQHSEELILNADEVIKSPGIPETAPVVAKLISQGTKIISEIEFAGRYDNAKKICITGSNGKTTTTSLIYHICQLAGLNVGLGGNIGKSYAYQVATEKHDYYVLELSSFQLDNMYEFKADVAVITNITPDHLDRYDHKMENYAKAKFRVIQNMGAGDSFIYCSDDPQTMHYMPKLQTKAKKLPFNIEDNNIVNIKTLSLSGKHNIYNSMAATLAARAINIDEEIIQRGLSTFQAVEHRLEKVREVNGVVYINDSKATNVDAAWYALECQTKPIIWIVGGTDKGNDYEPLKGFAKEKVKAIVCLGIDNAKIHKSFEDVVDTIVDVQSAKACVETAQKLAVEGDVVLLSPCCASFDLFKNYEDRGRQFKEAVMSL